MSDQFVIRTPLLPLNKLPGNSIELLDSYKSPIVRQALFVASRDLYTELLNIEKGLITDSAKKDKILVSLYKYYTRMSTRCTPFGYFSGLNTGNFTDRSNISLSEIIHPRIRIDMDYLCNLYYDVSSDRAVLPKLFFLPNNTLYKVYDQWRYVEYQFRNNNRYHNLVSVEDNEVLSSLITAGGGPKTIFRLAEAVMLFGFGQDEAMEYIMELVRSQVFVSELYPSVSGPEYQNRLFARLEQIAPGKYGGLHTDINALLAAKQNVIEKTTALEQKLSALNIPISPNRLLQVDLLKEATECTLDTRIKKKVEEITRLLAVLQPSSHNRNPIEKFKRAFFERYERAFMPLMYVMDTDIGLDYKDAVAEANSSDLLPSPAEQQLKAWKLQLYTKANKQGSLHIALTDKDIAQFKNLPQPVLPDSYSFMGSVYKGENEQFMIRYRHAAGPSATAILGRFGHLHPDIEKLCCSLAAQEQTNYSNCILAEIVHLPQGRLGNIVTRPQLRSYEIPYLGLSTLPPEQQITADDLYVGVVNSRVVLYSKKHNKEVIPRMGNAHNFRTGSLPVYHFLCDLQTQQINNSIFWTWDELYHEAFLPRISYKDVILSPACWNVFTAPFKKLDPETDNKLIVEKLKQLNVPDRFLICQADNELYIDINVPLGISTFISFCKKYDSLRLEEFLFTHQNAPGGFTNQVVIPYINHKPVAYNGVINVPVKQAVRRMFSPASRWVYFKIYTGKVFSEKLLMNDIPQLVHALKKKKIIQKWFFIRFADPKNHLRLRFLLPSEDKREELMQEIQRYFKKYIDEHIIWDLQLATYKREIERYGETTINDCENWFYHNSDLVLDLLKMLKPYDNTPRFLYGIYYMAQITAHFFNTPGEKAGFFRSQSISFGREFSVDKNRQTREGLNEKFRIFHPAMAAIFAGVPPENDVLFEPVTNLYAKNEAVTRNIIKNIKRKTRSNAGLAHSIAASFIHMFINRFFSVNQRHMEMEMYYFMNKYFASVIARQKALDSN